jgi:hypothetical protein
MLMPVKLNSFTQLRAQLVLHDRGILAHAPSVTGHFSFDTQTLSTLIGLLKLHTPPTYGANHDDDEEDEPLPSRTTHWLSS